MRFRSFFLTEVFILLFLLLPASAQWNLAPLISSFFDDEFDDWMTPPSFLRAGRSSYPRHEVTDTEDQFSVSMDLEGVADDSIHVKVEDVQDGYTMPVLIVQGHLTVEDENYHYQTSFCQRFTLSSRVRLDEIVATRRPSDGRLIITAPKSPAIEGKPSREIPIQNLEAIELSQTATTQEQQHGISQAKTTEEQHENNTDFLPAHPSSLEEHPKSPNKLLRDKKEPSFPFPSPDML